MAVVPAFSVVLEPGTHVISTHNGASSTVTVGVTSNLNREVPGVLRLELPQGWRSEPAQFDVKFTRRGEKQDFQFKVFPAGLQEGRRPSARGAGRGGREIQRRLHAGDPRGPGQLLLLPAGMQRVSIVDVQVPHDLKIGYIMGAGDDIPTVLQQLGMNVTLIPPEKLAAKT